MFAAVGIAACGGIPGNAVVDVGGTAITHATFDHWMEVAAASSRVSPTSKIVLPEPPEYTACIKHLEETSAKPVKGSKAPTKSELKSQCSQQYKSLQQEVLGFLISSNWVIGEALARHEADRRCRHEGIPKIKAEEFPKPRNSRNSCRAPARRPPTCCCA